MTGPWQHPPTDLPVAVCPVCGDSVGVRDLVAGVPTPGRVYAEHNDWREQGRADLVMCSGGGRRLPVPYVLPSRGCCDAGARAYPDSCPWHPPSEPDVR